MIWYIIVAILSVARVGVFIVIIRLYIFVTDNNCLWPYPLSWIFMFKLQQV
jgi:hypothetical protein